MPIRCRYCEVVKSTPEKAFAMIDDLPLTAQWLPPCVSLENTTGSPNKPGDKLRYVYRQGGREGQMEGFISERLPEKRLHCIYSDNSFTVSVDISIEASPEGVLMTHTIEITPKTFMGVLLWPLIRLGLGKQTREAANNLKRLLESN